MVAVKKVKKQENVSNKEQIVKASYKLILQNGYNATSLRDIAKEAGVSIGGIYAHFENKYEIYFHIIHEVIPFRNILPILEKNIGKEPEDFFRSVARAWAACFSFDEFRFVLIDWIEFRGDSLHKYFEMEMPSCDKMMKSKLFQNYQSWVKSGKIKPFDLHLVLGTLIHTISIFLVTKDLQSDKKGITKRIQEGSIDQVIDMFIHGIIN